MKKVILFLTENKIQFYPTQATVYTMLVVRATEQQTNDLINLIEAEGLLYKIDGGVAFYEPVPVEKKGKKK